MVDPTLSKSQAHNLFGELYRKERSATAQAEIDIFIGEVSDVFVRLAKIEEVDERERQKKLGEQVAAREKQSRRAKRSGSGAGGTGGTGGRSGAGVARKEATPRGNQALTDRAGGSATGSAGGGLFTNLFGGEVAKWGQETGTLSAGFLALNLKVSQRVLDLYSGLTEEQIIASIKSFRAMVRNSWEVWDPRRYNTMVTSFQFLTEFVNLSSISRRYEDPAEWVAQTVKMQKYYAHLLRYPDYQQTLIEEIPKLASNYRDLGVQIAYLKSSMNYLANLDSKTPTLRNSILAYYALARKEVLSWEELVSELRVSPPVLESYRAPPQIQVTINGKQRQVQQRLQQIDSSIAEIEEIRKRYFTADENGKLRLDFLDQVITDVLRRVFPENLLSEKVVQAYRSAPHRLLFVALRDFEITYINFLGGSVPTDYDQGQEDVIIFRPGLFRNYLDELSLVSREAETFVRKNSDFEYSFRDFMEDQKTGEPRDDKVRFLFSIIHKASRLFRLISSDIKTVLDNHKMVTEHESAGGKIKESMALTRRSAIENCQIGMRFLPYASRQIATVDRLNGVTIEDAIFQLLRNLYNYLYILRDSELLSTLASTGKLMTEKKALQRELERLGGRSDNLPEEPEV